MSACTSWLLSRVATRRFFYIAVIVGIFLGLGASLVLLILVLLLIAFLCFTLVAVASARLMRLPSGFARLSTLENLIIDVSVTLLPESPSAELHVYDPYATSERPPYGGFLARLRGELLHKVAYENKLVLSEISQWMSDATVRGKWRPPLERGLILCVACGTAYHRKPALTAGCDRCERTFTYNDLASSFCEDCDRLYFRLAPTTSRSLITRSGEWLCSQCRQ